MSTVLFVCLHNAGRSQMSQALFDRASAGRHTSSVRRHHSWRPRPPRSPRRSWRELDIDLTDRRPQSFTTELAEQADIIVTMGCGDECPFIPGKRYIDWELPDPRGRPVNEVRKTRDEIQRRVTALLEEL